MFIWNNFSSKILKLLTLFLTTLLSPILKTYFRITQISALASALVFGLVLGTALGLGSCNTRKFSATVSQQDGASTEQQAYEWAGTLILPKPTIATAKRLNIGTVPQVGCPNLIEVIGERRADGGVFIELQNTPDKFKFLKGKTVWLRYKADSASKQWSKYVTRPVQFSAQAKESVVTLKKFHPQRINCWNNVSPLESLAGSSLSDNLKMMLENVTVTPTYEKNANGQAQESAVLEISVEPVQISGFQKMLVQIVDDNNFTKRELTVQHFSKNANNKTAEIGSFAGMRETIAIDYEGEQQVPQIFSLQKIAQMSKEKYPKGWYVYGERNLNGQFVATGMEPRDLLSVNSQHEGIIFGEKNVRNYIYETSFDKLEEKKNTFWKQPLFPHATQKDFLNSEGSEPEFSKNANEVWTENQEGLVVHLFGGIDGRNGESKIPVVDFVAGHLAYGVAKVVRDTISGDLLFDITYKQVWGHGREEIYAGSHKWNHYQGDFRKGWAWSRPISDVIIRNPYLFQNFNYQGHNFSAMRGAPAKNHRGILDELDFMAARYRIGNGQGIASVNSWNSCSQDSSRALYFALKRFSDLSDSEFTQAVSRSSRDYSTFQKIDSIRQTLRDTLQLSKWDRSDWKEEYENLSAMDKNGVNLPRAEWMVPEQKILDLVKSFPTMMPRNVHDEAILAFLSSPGASAWMMRGNQLGGVIPGTCPMAPTTLLNRAKRVPCKN